MAQTFEVDCGHPRAGLSGPQRKALDAILSGATITDAAKVAGVHRQAVSKWRNQHEGFMAALDAGRDSIRRALSETMLSVCCKALGALDTLLSTEGLDPALVLRAADVALTRAAAAGVWPADEDNPRIITVRFEGDPDAGLPAVHPMRANEGRDND